MKITVVFAMLFTIFLNYSYANEPESISDSIKEKVQVFSENIKNKLENNKEKISDYFKIYPVDRIYKSRTDGILISHNLDNRLKGKERRVALKPYRNQIVSYPNEFEKLIDKSSISSTKTILIVGENIKKRDSFYDNVFFYGATVMDTFIVLGAILIPILSFFYLLPLGIYSIYILIKEKRKPTFSDIAVYLGLILAFYITFRVGYFYSVNVYDSFGTLFNELLAGILLLLLVIFMIPFFLLYLMSLLSLDSKGFEFYPDGTMLDIATELTRIHLLNIGITVEIDKELLIVILKIILLVLMLRNIKLAINAIFVTSSELIRWSFYFISVGILFWSIYYFNQDLIKLLLQFINELYLIYKG